MPLTLGGGTFRAAGFSEQLGTLMLAASSVIDLGAGAGAVRFADSSAVAWTGGAALTVTNWNGSVTGGGAGQLVFGSSNSGLTSSQVAQIQFANPAGLPAGTYTARILASGEVVPFIPAPALSGAGFAANGHFQLSVAGVTDCSYVVWGSTNLSNWVSLQTNVSPFTFTDPEALPTRFYRAQFVP